jgi:NagD protein
MQTDIRGGVQMGYKTILVLSGVSAREDLRNYAFQPDLIVESIRDIKVPLDIFVKQGNNAIMENT